MAPSPAAGKQPAAAPKTPTKLTRKPAATPSSQKPAQAASSVTKKTPASATPKAAPKKLNTPSAKPAAAPKTDDVEESAQSGAEDVKGKAEAASSEAQSQLQSRAGDDDEDGPMSKVSQASEQAEEGLQQAAPEPIDDDEEDQEGEQDDDQDQEATSGAEEHAEPEDEGEQAEDQGDETETTEKAGQTVESADDATEDQEQDQDQSGGLLKGAQGLAGKASGLAGKATKDPAGAADDAKERAEDAADGAQDTAEEGLDEAQKVAGDGTDEADDVADQAGDAAEEAEGAAEDTGEKAGGLADGLPEPPEGLPLDLSVLKGLEVQPDGNVQDSEGNVIGRLAEGDAEDLEGYPIGDDGEILDDEGDLVGRVELVPDAIRKQLEEAKEAGTELPEGADDYLEQLQQYGEDAGEDEEEGEEEGPALPGLDIMNGLTCQIDGIIYDSEGNTIGQVTDGDPQELQNATLNDQGEFIDSEGNVVGHAEIHPEAADLVEQGVYPAAGAVGEEADEAAEDAGDMVDGVVDEAEDAAGEAVEGAEDQAEGIEDQLPGIEALEGKDIMDTGDVVDEGGNLLASIQDEELKRKIEAGEIDPSTLHINEEGQVVDQEGNVLDTLELAEGAAERLGGGPVLDARILEGRKVNKKGKVLDEDGEEIGELRDGELAECAGKKINDRGEVLDKQGNIIGHVNVIRGEAAENATKALLEELGELAQGEAKLPDLTILDGYKVNKSGKILNEDGEPIGQLIDGDLAECAGKKCNDSGDVLDKDGNVIGRVTTLNAEGEPEEQVEGGEEAEGVEDEQPEEGDQLPPLSILEGLTVNKSGNLLDDSGNIVGVLVEGDAKKLSKMGAQADAEGQFWDNRGHVIGRAETVAQEEGAEESPFAGLEGLHVVEDGWIQDENGHTVGYLTEGDANKLLGRVVDEDGDVLDKKGSVVGHAERYTPEEEPEQEPVDLSFLAGKTVNKAGFVIGDEGVPVARLIEGKAKDLAGKQLDDQGQLWNDKGQVIGRVELIPVEEREAKPEGPFAGLEGLRVVEDGKIADENDNIVGEITEGNPKKLIGLAVDEDGDIVDRYGNVKGHAEPLPEEEEVEVDNSILNGMVLNKQGYVVDDNGTPFGRLIEGDAKELAGRRCDENGYLYNDTGKVVGKCEVIPENERVTRPEGPFAGLEGLRVVEDGWVEDEDENRVGVIVEGNPKRLLGMAVDEDGDILDKYGNVKGRAEPWEAEEEAEVDLSALAGTRINKHGNAVDFSGQIIGRVVEGDVNSMVGKKVDGQGQIWDDAGNVVGRCELVYGQDTKPEGPFAGFDNLQINKDGTVTIPSGDIIGRVIEGDIQKLLGHAPDEDGEIVDKNGNVIGKAERWEPEEKERRINPMSGMRVNKEGEVRDENGDLIGRLTEGDLGHCVGQEIDDSGNVVDVDGNKIGEVTLLENIADDFEGPTEEELAEAAKREEERQIAEKMAAICTQTLERVQPICKQITEYMEKADRTPKDELDEEELVNNVKPLIEEAGRILQECNGSLRGLDPDGKIAAQAKGRAGTGEATPEEYRLAETLKELTSTVVTTIDNAKKKLNDMPHAKKKLNPLWALMTQPLFQILAAVGLLLAGVLGLVGQLLNGLGLGGLVNGLMGGLGINKLLSAFGIGGDDKKKKKGGGNKLSGLPIVGGLLGGSDK